MSKIQLSKKLLEFQKMCIYLHHVGIFHFKVFKNVPTHVGNRIENTKKNKNTRAYDM